MLFRSVQLFFPLACAAHFLRREARFDAAICGVWLAESLMYTARYLGDAQAQVLPLVGGHVHDWHWLLSGTDLLPSAGAMGAWVHAIASAMAVTAWLWAAREAWPKPVGWDRAPSHPRGGGNGGGPESSSRPIASRRSRWAASRSGVSRARISSSAERS